LVDEHTLAQPAVRLRDRLLTLLEQEGELVLNRRRVARRLPSSRFAGDRILVPGEQRDEAHLRALVGRGRPRRCPR
jgi:hypothetical protein